MTKKGIVLLHPTKSQSFVIRLLHAMKKGVDDYHDIGYNHENVIK